MNTGRFLAAAHRFSLPFIALAITFASSPANAEQLSCHVGKVMFEGPEACTLMQKISHGNEVPFRPFHVMGLINDICEALEGRMDERLRKDPRKTLFRTRDEFDCYQKGEPIWLPLVRDSMYRPQPLIIEQSWRRRR